MNAKPITLPAARANGHVEEPTEMEISLLKDSYAERGFVFFRNQAKRKGHPEWSLARRDRLTGILHRDFATFRNVDFAIALFEDSEVRVSAQASAQPPSALPSSAGNTVSQ